MSSGSENLREVAAAVFSERLDSLWAAAALALSVRVENFLATAASAWARSMASRSALLPVFPRNPPP